MQNVIRLQGFLKRYVNRKTRAAIHQKLGKDWKTITQLAQNKETRPEFGDALCSCRDHGVQYELKQELLFEAEKCTNPDT